MESYDENESEILVNMIKIKILIDSRNLIIAISIKKIKVIIISIINEL